MDPLLKLMRENAALTRGQMARMLDLPEAEIAAKIKAFEEGQIILGYRAVINEEKLGLDMVRAVIEVKITPERGGGFDRLAERIAKYAEVRSCYLMSGGYDLLVVVEGASLREVAAFVSEKLATIHGVHLHRDPFHAQDIQGAGPAGPRRSHGGAAGGLALNFRGAGVSQLGSGSNQCPATFMPITLTSFTA